MLPRSYVRCISQFGGRFATRVRQPLGTRSSLAGHFRSKLHSNLRSFLHHE
jgi:hypothetical protein